MNWRIAVCLFFVVMVFSCACEKRTDPNPNPSSSQSPAPAAAVSSRQLTNEAFLIWLDLVTVWHREHKADRLDHVAKASGWKELTPDMLELVGAKKGYGYTKGKSVVLIGGDEEGGLYQAVEKPTRTRAE